MDETRSAVSEWLANASGDQVTLGPIEVYEGDPNVVRMIGYIPEKIDGRTIVILWDSVYQDESLTGDSEDNWDNWEYYDDTSVSAAKKMVKKFRAQQRSNAQWEREETKWRREQEEEEHKARRPASLSEQMHTASEVSSPLEQGEVTVRQHHRSTPSGRVTSVKRHQRHILRSRV